MATDAEMRTKFWKSLKNDRTMFLGMAEGEDGHARPMTAQLEDELYDDGEYHGPVWFFTSTDNALYQMIQQAELANTNPRAMAHFASKGHDLWASVQGTLTTTRDRATIDRLWNRFVAAWYDGKDDPKIALIRLDADKAEIWIDASSLVAGIKMLIGIDPKKDYEGKVAEVRL
ncbi:pyridoxamine 5'-phosphate oxidase family protein [Porphyrobacter sp. SLTP]|jgi:general stress protein 26|uniref:pyridoxamine 5'-phosphate oxidase family protein n=1 Tax=Porphyrobacter sp. SLTP TaxID=2683266 RepID=UPI00141243CA|nr:pyridoxamine 5'-phosphate oxidase family protein [Porphyrobacter sp. SLTP]NBB24735.1 pyridoxamine 5'-phosphate oxidase family protein [Porphyrobacter sp. SLTP]